MLGGLVDLQHLLRAQVSEVVENPESLEKTSHPITYHRLLDSEANKATGIPLAGSLYEEAQALLFGGSESSGNTCTIGLFHALQDPEILRKLKSELSGSWPRLMDMPSLEELEKLPYLTAFIKESLRVAPGVPTPLLRTVPQNRANISGKEIPGGTIVGMGGTFVHSSGDVFSQPERFDPDRWLQPNSASSEKRLVPFSRGPRACMGQKLAICELYLAFAALFRRFDIRLDGTKAEDLSWKECFLPLFNAKHMRAFCRPVKD